LTRLRGLTAVLVLGLAACSRPSAEQQMTDARQRFEQIVREQHLPSATATGAERDRLLAQAATGYEEILRRCPLATNTCAQALRSLGNVRAAQGLTDDAVRLYRQVAERYPDEAWEILQAWKSAADLLGEAGRANEARAFDRLIVDRFDRPDARPIEQTIVRAARARLSRP
jgi:tetratricopeptide (TPR) repeat protein